MIQLASFSFPGIFIFYLNIYDVMIKNGSETTMSPLLSFTSQLTGNTKNTLSFGGWSFGNKERSVRMVLSIVSSDIPLTGNIKLGTTDFPYGIYDMKVYQNDPSTPENLDPDNAIKLLYTGLMNLREIGNNKAVEYTDYTTNDSDTESVYITF